MAYLKSVGDDDIEMPVEWVGKGSDPNVMGQAPPPAAPSAPLAESLKSIFGTVEGAIRSFGGGSPTVATNAAGKTVAVPGKSTMDKVLAAGPLLLLVGTVTYFAFKKKDY